MFEKFENTYPPAPSRGAIAEELNRSAQAGLEMKDLSEFFARFSGASFGEGVYRVHDVANIEHWNVMVAKTFPEFSRRIQCFGYDWLGRQFALDQARKINGNSAVLMLEPGTGEVLEIPASLTSFHDVELVEHGNEALATDFYAQWRKSGGGIPKVSECCGYSRPLFLGGQDEIGNLELVDMDVYWGVIGQLLGKVRSLPPGTPINSFDIS